MNKFFKPYQLVQLIAVLFKELIREPEVLFWGIGFPILMSLGLGIAFTKKADLVINVAVLDVQETGNTAGQTQYDTLPKFQILTPLVVCIPNL